MASAAAAAGEASTSGPATREKPIVVRVKRKPSQTRPDAFWLEINERPAKKAMLDFSSLSISEPSSAMHKASEEQPRVKKLLVQHIETVHHSQAVEDVLHSLLLADSAIKEMKSKTKEWNDRIKQDKKPDQLRSAARQRHEVPFMLQRLRYLEVFGCGQLKMIDSKAPNISSFSYEGDHIQLSLGETLQMKKLDIFFHGAVHYARV
ncbi:RNA-directed DNA methylation 4 [Setaria italica]|uniref:RNA-directed DNA methylation 4 n=1 Tax=Setaria italica TaxID=4555 RepID=UPI000BE513B8|nr:RNA-directed DNA methylation 4 [Setaria italica]